MFEVKKETETSSQKQVKQLATRVYLFFGCLTIFATFNSIKMLYNA